MKIRGLQQQLANSTYLLPSQRDLLSRLLFQLAFNDFTRLAIFGPEGSGKSTLALTLAELFSECEEVPVNVALLQAPIAIDQLVAQLGQQWFANAHLATSVLERKITEESSSTEWILIIDNPEQLTTEQHEWLASLAVRTFMFASSAQQDVQLNLAIPTLTLADCEHLLQAEKLNPLLLAERFANCQGSLYQLLTKNVVKAPVSEKTAAAKTPLYSLAIGIMLVVLVLIFILKDQGDVSESVTVEPVAQLSNESEEHLPQVEKPTQFDLEPVLTEITELPGVDKPVESGVDNALVMDEQQDPVVATISTNEESKRDNSEIVVASAEEKKPQSIVPATPAQQEQLEEIIAIFDHTTLLAAPPKDVVVQLAVLSTENGLNLFRQNYPQLAFLVYQRSWQGKAQWIIVSKPFTNSELAKQYIKKLPKSLNSSGPFIKTVGAVQQEIQAWQRLKLTKTNQGN